MNDSYVNVKQAAEILRVSRMHVYRMARRGWLTIEQANPCYIKGGPTRIKRSQVEALAHEKGITLHE